MDKSLIIYILSAFMLCFGIYLLLSRKHIIVALLGIELMLNASIINFVAFSFNDVSKLSGQTMALLVLAVAALDAAIALTFVVRANYFFGSPWLTDITPSQEDWDREELRKPLTQ